MNKQQLKKLVVEEVRHVIKQNDRSPVAHKLKIIERRSQSLDEEGYKWLDEITSLIVQKLIKMTEK